MQFLTMILFSILSAVSMAKTYRNPPYCTPTGPGVCNLGWEFDWDINKFHIWVYDRNCNELGNKDYVGWFLEEIDTKLPNQLFVANKREGPNFAYNSVGYKREDCWYMQGPTNWQYAGQCAFLCEAPGDGSGGQSDGLKTQGGPVPLNETLIASLDN